MSLATYRLEVYANDYCEAWLVRPDEDDVLLLCGTPQHVANTLAFRIAIIPDTKVGE